MHQPTSVLSPIDIEHPKCTACGVSMWLTRILSRTSRITISAHSSAKRVAALRPQLSTECRQAGSSNSFDAQVDLRNQGRTTGKRVR